MMETSKGCLDMELEACGANEAIFRTPTAAPFAPLYASGSASGVTSGTNSTAVGCRVFTFEDQVRPSSRAAVHALRSGKWRSERPRPADALRVIMLTGDNEDSAHRVAASLGITDVRAGVHSAVVGFLILKLKTCNPLKAK